MSFRRKLAAAIALSALAALGAATAGAGEGRSGDTRADYTPGAAFGPLATSTPCMSATDRPFHVPPRYRQQVVAQEGEGGAIDLWDMNTQNEFGRDAGRYLYRTHETPAGSQVTVTDLKEGDTRILVQRPDWERFDGIVWTPHGTVLAAEEVSDSEIGDPDALGAQAGLVYEFFVDPRRPDRLNPADPRDDVGRRDGIAVRPALGSKSHEGMRFDRRGFAYGITEDGPGSIFRFIPDRRGDLSDGRLQALRTPNGRTGQGVWVDIPDGAARTDAQPAADARGANGYQRPEDVETGESTGRDRSNAGHTLYVAITDTHEVLAVDLSAPQRPFAYQYVGARAGNAAPPAFDSPDNLALDRRGNLAITEDPGGEPPEKSRGDDIFLASPPHGGHGVPRRRPARMVGRFASLRDCVAEPTGVYFALEGTARFTRGTPRERLVGDETLFLNRQHAGQGTSQDQLVAIGPVDAQTDGTAGSDVLVGTPGDDVIRCGSGNDRVDAGAGDDVVFCGSGNDVIRGGAGDDRLYGESGNDAVFGESGNDLIDGGSGNDRLVGGWGRDRFREGMGRDSTSR